MEEKWIKKYPCSKCKHYKNNLCINPEQKHHQAKTKVYDGNKFSCLKFEE